MIRYPIQAAIFILGCCSAISCTNKQTKDTASIFTEVDSLTEIYLDLQDSILVTWNLMLNDDNQRIKRLHSLLHELQVIGQIDPQELAALQTRLKLLKETRFTPKTISDNQLVDEYDFATNSLVAEILSLAESHSAYSYNTTMQHLVDEIRSSEQRVEAARITYDSVVLAYNHFIMRHKQYMHDIDPNNSLEKKPVFQLTTE